MERPLDERRWVARFREGDTSAFEEIMTHYEPYILGLLWRLSGDRSTAEDLCQETFMRALKALQRFRSDSGLKTWLYRIAHNAATDHFRAAKREEPFEEEIAKAPGSGPQSDALGSLEETRLRAAIEQAMGLLPRSQREVLHLFYWDEFSVSEIAESLGLPEGTVKTHLFRGRNAIRERALGLCAEAAR